MSREAPQQHFLREMDKLRRGPRRIEAEEIAQVARKAGLSAHQGLLQILEFTGYGRQRSGEMFEALSLFLSSLCNEPKTKRILEYATTPSLLTAQVANGPELKKMTYIAPYEHTANVLRILLQGTDALVLQSEKQLGKDPLFDAIVCVPQLGHSSHKETDVDGFGGEVVLQLLPFLAKEGTFYWITGRGAVVSVRAKRTLDILRAERVHAVASVDVAPGAFPGSMIEGVVLAFRWEALTKRFVGVLRDIESGHPMAAAFLAGPSRKSGANWTWLESEDEKTFLDIEHARLLQKLTPRGRHSMIPLGSLLLPGKIEKADRPANEEARVAAFLYVPEYAGSRVTADLEEQTVNPKAVFRLEIDPAKANPRFLARLLNSPFGRKLRGDAASGATIQRVSAKTLLALELPVPDMATQDRLVRVDGDIGLLEASFREMRGVLNQNWSELPDIAEKIDSLKAVLDIERQIADWWLQLPYPLATIYRRYQVSQNPRDRLDTLLHFFEMAAVYLAAIGTSHVKAMRRDWKDVMAKWLHPSSAAGIERADFGFWIGLAGASLKDASRIASDKDLREIANEIAGVELVQVASVIGTLGKATEVLDVARRQRNSWIGHGGHLKPSDAARVEADLQQSVRDLYEITASVFRHFQLVRPGTAEVMDSGFRFQIEKLAGSDPTFETELVELERPAKSRSLAFWMRGARTMCQTMPFFRLGAPMQPQETSFYVFNRVEKGSFRWISYQETREQEFIASDEELVSLIALGRDPK